MKSLFYTFPKNFQQIIYGSDSLTHPWLFWQLLSFQQFCPPLGPQWLQWLLDKWRAVPPCEWLLHSQISQHHTQNFQFLVILLGQDEAPHWKVRDLEIWCGCQVATSCNTEVREKLTPCGMNLDHCRIEHRVSLTNGCFPLQETNLKVFPCFPFKEMPYIHICQDRFVSFQLIMKHKQSPSWITFLHSSTPHLFSPSFSLSWV